MNLRFKTLVILLGAFWFSFQAFGHGEDKLGPHGGYIRMPGGFHTELIQISDQHFKVFLLDIHWKNPTIKNSSVKALVTFNSSEIEAECTSKNNYFFCVLPQGKTISGAKRIKLFAKRDNTIVGSADYDLPLRFFSYQPNQKSRNSIENKTRDH